MAVNYYGSPIRVSGLEEDVVMEEIPQQHESQDIELQLEDVEAAHGAAMLDQIYGANIPHGQSRPNESDGRQFQECVAENGGSIPLNVHDTFCSCKSQCTLARTPGGNRGCPCKGQSKTCNDKCKCGSRSKPCKNTNQNLALELQKNPCQNHDIQPHDQMQNGAAENIVPVRDILAALEPNELLEVAIKGFQYRRNFLNDIITEMKVEHLLGAATSQQEGPNGEGAAVEDHKDIEPAHQIPQHVEQPVTLRPTFCRCGWCREMPTDKERRCCGQHHLCRSRTQDFRNICIDSENLATAIRNLSDTYVFTPVYDNRACRHAGYRQYVMWQNGHLGAGNRVVIPSCCVWAIRKAYPSPDGRYTGFKSA